MTTEAFRNIRLEAPTLGPWRAGSNRDIIALMSGGVDSSITALLLKEQGWNVVGVTMRIPLAERCDKERSCCGAEAGYVCRDLGIPHYFLDTREAFRELVIQPFREAYASGATPSPCIDCNTDLKFGLVWDYLEQALGVSHLATGHYARVVHDQDRAFLACAADLRRDQSYFLCGIPLRRLPQLHFPLGGFAKDEVREMARKSGLPVARKPDSMELCFAGEADYREALGEGAGQEGDIVDSSGSVLGRHTGVHNFTIGQRRGIGIAAPEPLYVIAIDAKARSVVVGSKDECLRQRVAARSLNVLIPEALRVGSRLHAKIRSQGSVAPCAIEALSDSSVAVVFDTPQLAPAPGQRLVLYDDDSRVAAGAVIASSGNSEP